MALKLDIRPFETVYINGAEICNGERKISLVIMNKSRILRQSEMVKSEETHSLTGKFAALLQEFILKDNTDVLLPELERISTEISRSMPLLDFHVLEIQKLLAEGKPHAAFKVGKAIMALQNKEAVEAQYI